MTAGPRNALTDVPGLRVGQVQRRDGGFLTGTTVVLPDGPALAGVDVRGGGPATRDTAALDPRHGPVRARAVVLTGGSAYGLAAADGVLAVLAGEDGGAPLVPAAAVFDLGRGGDFRSRPDAAFGAEALAAARTGSPVAQGTVGAGTGAVSAEMKGGVGTASAVLDDGTTVGALAVLNAHGSALDARTGLPRGLAAGFDGEFPLTAPDPDEHAEARRRLADPGRPVAGLRLPNTVIGVVATDAPLDAAQVHRAAAAGQRGLVRAVSPVHGLGDGDAVFALAPPGGAGAAKDRLAAVLAAAERAFTRAVVHALLAASSTTTPFGHVACYRELYPGATAALGPHADREAL